MQVFQIRILWDQQNLKKDSAIFTTYDSSKGLERKIEICFRTYARAFYSVRKLRCCDGNEERNTLEYKR